MKLLHDFYPLWAAGRLAKNGLNPYDNEALVSTLVNAGAQISEFPGGFHYPPWTLWIFRLLGYFTLEQALILWFTLNVILLCFVIKISFKLIDRKYISNNLVTNTIICLSFLPLLKSLLIGQTSIILFLGLLIYLKNRNNNSLISSIGLSICTIKPHLFIVISPFWLIFHINKKRYIILALTLLFIVTQLFISILLSPNIINNFITEITTLSAERAKIIQVTIGHVLNLIFNQSYFNTLLPLVLCLLVFAYSIKFKKFNTKNEWTILAISLICSPYAYAHDLILLFPMYLLVCLYFIKIYPTLTQTLINITSLVILNFWMQNFATYEILYLFIPIILIVISFFKEEIFKLFILQNNYKTLSKS